MNSGPVLFGGTPGMKLAEKTEQEVKSDLTKDTTSTPYLRTINPA